MKYSFLSVQRLSDRKTVTDRLIAVRETGVSRHQGDPIEGPPETPRTSQHYHIKEMEILFSQCSFQLERPEVNAPAKCSPFLDRTFRIVCIKLIYFLCFKPIQFNLLSQVSSIFEVNSVQFIESIEFNLLSQFSSIFEFNLLSFSLFFS